MLYVIKWLFPYWKKHRYRMIVIVVFGLLSAVLSALIPYYIKKIINGFEVELSAEYLKTNVLIMLSLGFAHYITDLTAMVNRAYMNYVIEYEIRRKFFKHLLSLDDTLFWKYNAGDVLTRLMDDISEKISWFSCSGVFRFLQAIFTIISVISVMIYINFELTLVAILPLPFLLYFITRFRKVLFDNYDKLQKSISRIYDFLETSFGGIKLIKANNKERNFFARFCDLTEDEKNKFTEAEKKHIFIRYLFFGMGTLSVLLVYFWGGVNIILHDKFSIGELVSFQVYAFMLIFPVSDVSEFFVTGKRAHVSIKRLDEIFKMRPSVKSVKKYELGNIDSILLKKLSVKIEDKYILNDINAEIKKGSKIAVVGKIGSSKSTLIKILSRLMEYNEGEFLLNGVNIREYFLEDYYSKIAYIPQDSYIISDTVLNNITLYNNYSDDDLEKVIKVCQLEEDIKLMKKGLNTVVGNKGVRISGGQRQRINIARALLKKPEIIFMDDATNQMDANTEHKFWNLFFEYYPDITIVFVTHRTKTIEKAEVVWVMDSGKIVEKGRHEELLSKKGLYFNIYSKIQLEESF